MNHDEIRELLDAYVDGEIDLVSSREIDQHLQSCGECRGVKEQIQNLHTAITSDSPAYRAPAHLRKNVRAALRREVKSGRKTFSLWPIFATAAACTAVILAFALLQATRTSHPNSIADEVIANHVRSLLATHLVDVASSDQHTVKPWFDGKIDFAPEVHDFSTSGFPLAGGRLDYLEGKTAAALVYQRNKHPINVFILPATGHGDSPPVASSRRGYNIISWTSREMDYWSVSDLNQIELRQLVGLLSR